MRYQTDPIRSPEMTKEQIRQLETDLRAAAQKTPKALEGILEYHHIAMRIEFDGANKKERVFSACLPGMRLAAPKPGQSPFILAHFPVPSEAVSALTKALEGKTLRSEDEFKQVQFPPALDAESMVKKLTPRTEAERQALNFVTDIAVKMVVPFSITREAYDDLWLATMGAGVLQAESGSQRQRLVPIIIGNDDPLVAVEDMARQLSGELLCRREMEFHAPVLPVVRYTLQEELRAGERPRKDWAFGEHPPGYLWAVP